MSIRMGLREANQRFSKAVKAIKAGKDVVLTERGNAIAIIRPLPREEDPNAVMERLHAEGLLTLAVSSKPMPPFKARPIRGETASMTLHRERNEK